MISALFSVAVTFFLILDPLGNIPIFVSLLGNRKPEKQRKIILRELLIALVIMVFFFYLGEAILDMLHISQFAVQISGGIILFLIALEMIFPKPSPGPTAEPRTEPFIVPLAVPLVAGPSVLATIMIYSHQQQRATTVLLALLLAWAASLAILLASSWFAKILGPRGLKACERMMGLILTLLAVQLFLQGVSTLTASR